MPDLFIAEKKPKKSSSQTEHNTPPPAASLPGTPTVLSKFQEHAHAITAYTRFPDNIAFDNQEKDEVIHLFVRRHFVTNAGWILFSIILLFLPIILGPIILASLEVASLRIPTPYILVLLLFYFLIVLYYAFLNYISWFYNAGIVTNLRVIDIDLTDITHKNVAATAIADLVDVTYSQKGFLQSTFDYGNVHIQTEGLKPNFEFLKIPKPADAADVITDLIRGVRHA